jgi:hypothetical protein
VRGDDIDTAPCQRPGAGWIEEGDGDGLGVACAAADGVAGEGAAKGGLGDFEPTSGPWAVHDESTAPIARTQHR